MAIIAPIAPPIVAPLPTPPSTSDPVNFDPRADNFLGALPANQGQMNALGTNVYDNALKTYNSATDANNAASAAVPAAATATQAASVASASLASMQKLYLGAKTTAPFVDNQGNPLELGAWYTNTVTGFWYWWSGSSWKIGVSDLSVVDWDTQVVGKPVTVNGYGITNAVTTDGNQDISGNKIYSGSTVFPSGTGAVGSDTASGRVRIGSSTAPAVISFFNGPYGVNLGLDADNAFRLGGWIDGAAGYRLQSLQNGNLIAKGDITSLSDERLKTDWMPVHSNLLSKVENVKYGTYCRKDTSMRQAGVSAQDWLNVLPETVTEGEDGTLSVAYGNAAMIVCLELAKEVKRLRSLVEELKKGVI